MKNRLAAFKTSQARKKKMDTHMSRDEFWGQQVLGRGQGREFAVCHSTERLRGRDETCAVPRMNWPIYQGLFGSCRV